MRATTLRTPTLRTPTLRTPTLRTPILCALLFLLAAAVPVPRLAAQEPPDDAVHPFYAQLLEEGIYTYHRGDPSAAAADLRLAVFGLLEDPPRLAEGLAYLALAQQQTGETEGMRETLGRLITVEDRFGTWGRLELSPEVRGEVEELLTREVPEAVLGASAGFRELADESFLRRIAGMEAEERREALIGRVEQRPGEPRWLLALARAELALGDTRAAAVLADRVLADDGSAAAGHHPAAHCVLGEAAARNTDCATVIEHLPLCPRSRQELEPAVELLGCQVESQRWESARELLAALPASLRAERPVRRLARRVPELVEPVPTEAAAPVPAEAAGTEAAGTEAAETETTGTEAAETEAADGAAEPVLPDAARARLDRARELLSRARRAGELEEPLRIAREVADAHPDVAAAQHLAGEIAYRASRWQVAADYYRRGGEPDRPEQRFYMAVALYESGDGEGAARVLETALPGLPRNPFVTSYVERILGDADGGSGPARGNSDG